jgi:beta-glucanase (GH16 family)
MKNLIILIFLTLTLTSQAAKPTHYKGWQLTWSDEFNTNGKPNPANWKFEHGFTRNQEYQWYQEDNAFCENGLLIIEGRREKIKNPRFDSTSNDWKRNREYAEYSASSLNTAGLKEFRYGRFEIRARIDTSMGLWPAIWTLGVNGRWPSNGEIDLMESYPINGEHNILANVACGAKQAYKAKWDSQKIPLSHFLSKDPLWPSKFHIWRMDWDSTSIKLYLDDELLNETLLRDALNPDGTSPFNQQHYILLNLAIGGQNGGDPSLTKFPTRYEIDYVRVYRKK